MNGRAKWAKDRERSCQATFIGHRWCRLVCEPSRELLAVAYFVPFFVAVQVTLMPTITVRLESPVRRSFRVSQVAGMLDVPLEKRLNHELTAEVPSLAEPWTIGVIVGPSGSGKTTLAISAFGGIDEPRDWPADAAIVDCLGCQATDRRDACPTVKELARVLVGVGLGSVPTWLKPYQALSTGERFRADLARAIIGASGGNTSAARCVVIDEFGSTLDRTMAMTASAALARLVRSGFAGSVAGDGQARRLSYESLRLVALTCHDDIVPWLEPDWVLRLGDADGPRLERTRLARPELELRVERVPQATWRLFSQHHYLTGGLAASATCYAAWIVDADYKSPVAFCAVAPALGWKKTKRITRLVTLPEFQGLGIGSRLLELVAEQEASRGNRVTITASHPAILSHCSHSPRWRFRKIKKTGSTPQRFGEREISSSVGRAVAAFEYVGGPLSVVSRQQLPKPTNH